MAQVTAQVLLQAIMDTKGVNKGMNDVDKNASKLQKNLDDKFKNLGKTIAAAFGATVVLNAIKNLATASLGLAADINTLASSLGITTEQLSIMQASAIMAGDSTDKMSASLRQLVVRLGEAKAGSEATQKLFEALGIDVSTSSIEDVIKKLFELGVAANEAGGTVEYIGKISKIVGAETALVWVNATKGAKNYEDAIRKATEAGLVLDTATGQFADNFKAEMAAIERSIQISFIEGFKDAFKGIDTKELQKNLSALAENVGLLVGAVAQLASEDGGFRDLKDSGTSAFALLSAALIGITNLTDKFSVKSIKAGNSVKEGFTTTATRNIGQVGQKLGEATASAEKFAKLKTVFSGVGKAISPVLKILGKLTIVLTTVFFIYDYIKALNAYENAWLALRDALLNIIPFMDNVTDKWQKNAIKVREGAIKAGQGFGVLKKDMNDAFQALVNWGVEDVPKTFNMMEGIVPKFFELSPELKKSIQDDLKSVLDFDWSQNQEEVNKIYEIFSGKKAKIEVPAKLIFLSKEEQIELLNKEAESFSDKPIELWTQFQIAEEDKAKLEADFEKARTLLNLTDEQAKKFAESMGVPFQTLGDKIKLIAGSISESLKTAFSAGSNLLQIQIDGIQSRLDSVRQKQQDEQTRAEELGIQNTEAHKLRQEQLKREEEKLKKAAEAAFKRQKALNIIVATMTAIEGAMNAYSGTMSWSAKLGPWGIAIAAAAGATALGAGLANVAAIKAQPMPKFAKGGMVGGNQFSDSTNIAAQGGEFIVNRQATEANLGALEFINRGGRTGGQSVTVQIMGDVIGTNEFVENNLIPSLNNAYKRGIQMKFATA